MISLAGYYPIQALNSLSTFKDQAIIYGGYALTSLKADLLFQTISSALHHSLMTIIAVTTPLLQNILNLTLSYPISTSLIVGVSLVCYFVSWKETLKTV